MNLLAICLRIERDLSSLILTKMVLLIALIKQYVIVSSKKIKIKSNTTVINQKKKKKLTKIFLLFAIIKQYVITGV